MAAASLRRAGAAARRCAGVPGWNRRAENRELFVDGAALAFRAGDFFSR